MHSRYQYDKLSQNQYNKKDLSSSNVSASLIQILSSVNQGLATLFFVAGRSYNIVSH